MHNYLYTRLSLGLLLSFWAISVSTAASSSTSTSSLSLAPAQTRGRISKEIVRRQFYPKVKHGSEDAGGQYDVEMALGDSGGDGHYQEGFGRNPYRGSNLDEIEGVNRPPDPVTPTLLPILPLLNVTEPQDFTTSMILPNGNEVHIEQHVDIVYNQDNVQDKAPDNPRLEEIAAPHLISASISKAIPSSSQGKACRKPDTVTVTRTKQIQAVRTSTAREIVTVTQVRSRTRTKTRTAPGAGPPPGQPTTRPDAPPIPAPAPLPPSLPVPNPPKQETPKPKPRPKTKRPPKEQPTPEPRPQQPVQTKEVQNKNKAPAGYHAEMVKQHNKFRAEYGANPVGHNQEFVLKGEQWLRRCVTDFTYLPRLTYESSQLQDGTSVCLNYLFQPHSH